MGARVNDLLSETQFAIDTNDERRLLMLISQTIRESGVEIVVEAPYKNQRADLAVWSDEFIPLFGHPLLIETKLRIRSKVEACQVIKQCTEMTTSAGANWSIFLYGDGPSTTEKFWSTVAPTVLVLSVHDLFTKMRNQSFVDVIKDLRNRRVHGERF